MPSKVKKRFIAGAVCPQCHAIDSILWLQAPEESIQCVQCGYLQKKADIVSVPATKSPEQVIQWHRSTKSLDKKSS